MRKHILPVCEPLIKKILPPKHIHFSVCVKLQSKQSKLIPLSVKETAEWSVINMRMHVLAGTVAEQVCSCVCKRTEQLQALC